MAGTPAPAGPSVIATSAFAPICRLGVHSTSPSSRQCWRCLIGSPPISSLPPALPIGIAGSMPERPFLPEPFWGPLGKRALTPEETGSASASEGDHSDQADNEHDPQNGAFDAVAGRDQKDACCQEREGDHDAVIETPSVEPNLALIERGDAVQLLLDHRTGLGISFGVDLQRILITVVPGWPLAHCSSLRGRSKVSTPGAPVSSGDSVDPLTRSTICCSAWPTRCGAADGSTASIRAIA